MLTAVLGMMSCAAGVSSVRRAAPARHRPAVSDASTLAGQWITSLELGKEEPPPGPVTLEQPCYATYGEMQLSVHGDVVHGGYVAGTPMSGAIPALRTHAAETFQGKLQGNHLVLVGEYRVSYGWTVNPGVGLPKPPSPRPVRYDLTWNPRTHHLVGTKNGKPFWAAPRILRPRTRRCGPPPP